MNEVKECRKCHQRRKIGNKTLGWCRACLAKQHARFCYTKVLPHPEKYDDILARVALGMKQKQIAEDLQLSRQSVQRVVSRYTVLADETGKEWRP